MYETGWGCKLYILHWLKCTLHFLNLHSCSLHAHLLVCTACVTGIVWGKHSLIAGWVLGECSWCISGVCRVSAGWGQGECSWCRLECRGDCRWVLRWVQWELKHVIVAFLYNYDNIIPMGRLAVSFTTMFSQIDIVCMQCLWTFGEWLGAT